MGAPAETPLYVSKPTAKSLWQEYRLYPDRLELDMHLWGPIVVPLADVKAVAERPPLVVLDLLRGDATLSEALRTIKIDLADLHRHVTIEKDTGVWRQFRLTPEDNGEFIRQVEAARARLKR